MALASTFNLWGFTNTYRLLSVDFSYCWINVVEAWNSLEQRNQCTVPENSKLLQHIDYAGPHTYIWTDLASTSTFNLRRGVYTYVLKKLALITTFNTGEVHTYFRMNPSSHVQYEHIRNLETNVRGFTKLCWAIMSKTPQIPNIYELKKLIDPKEGNAYKLYIRVDQI